VDHSNASDDPHSLRRDRILFGGAGEFAHLPPVRPLGAVTRLFLPPIWPVLLILLLTGSLLIIGEPRRSLVNTTFYIKMSLLLIAIVPTVLLQRTILASPGFFEKRQTAIRALATVSILVWSGILFAGRWIAYTQAG
jgi:hypothetical protein